MNLDGITIEEFECLPDALALNHELVDGELVDVSGNTLGHNLLRGCWLVCFCSTSMNTSSAECISEQEYDFDGNAHGPDVTFFGPEKAKLLNGKLRVQRFVPDLAIEIVSQNDTILEALRKGASLSEVRHERGLDLLD